MVERDEGELGQELLRCRPLSGYETLAVTHGRLHAWLRHFLLIPLLCVPLFGLYFGCLVWGALDLVMTLRGEGGCPKWVLLAGLPVGCLPVLWFLYIYPRSRYLAVHEQGIRGKWPWRQFAVRFDDIQYVRVGAKPARWQEALDTVASVKSPNLVRLNTWLAANAMFLVLRSGKAKPLGYLFACFHADDAERFIELVFAKVPVYKCGDEPNQGR
jgi:hypothetical protein